MRVDNTHTAFRECVNRLRLLLLPLFIMLAAPLQAAQVTLTLTDNATGGTVADAQVIGYRIEADGSRQWLFKQNTNADGQLLVELENIENGTQYQFKTRALNGTDLFSGVISSVTEYNFVLGTKIIVLKNGADASQPPLANHRVDVKTPKEDGKLRWVTRATSDENGIVRFNLDDPSLQYVFSANSTLTNERKETELSSGTGEQEFVVGNLPLNISLVHGVTGTPIPAQRIEVRRLEADGSKSWAGRRETDASGNAVFDLNDLGNGSVYELYARNSDGFYAHLQVSETGTQEFRLGNARVTILNGREAAQPPHIGKRVDIFKQVGESRERVVSVNSNANGQILADLTELGTGTQYIARIRHEKKNYEAPITQSGDSSLVFGRLPQIIATTVFNTATNAPVAGERVELFRFDGDKKRHAGRADTDASGRVEFDAQGLYENQVFMVRINPFDGSAIESENITAAGEVNFNVHLQEDGFQVAVVDGTQAQPTAIPNQRVDVFKVNGDSLQYYTRRDTDDAGNVAFTLPDFDQGQQYVLRTRHTENGRHINSTPFASNGNHTFTVGTSPLSVSLLNPVTNAAIANARMDVVRSREDGSTYREARVTTDENGLAVFHITQITESSPATLKTWTEEGFYAEQQVTSNGTHNFILGNTQVTLRNGRDNNQALLNNHRVRIYKYVGEQRSRVFDRDTSEDGIALMKLDTLTGNEFYQAEVTVEGDRYKSTFTNTGDVQLVMGNHEEDIQVALLDGTGAQPSPIANERIAVHVVEGDRLKWVSNKNTDDEGEAKLALPGLSQGQQFVLKAKHPITGRWFESALITKESIANNAELDFVVGIQPMVVTLLNPVTEAPISNARIEVKRQRENGSWYREARETSDDNGQVTFHITEVSEDKPVKLEAWNQDNFHHSMEVTATGNHEFMLGNTQITLRNGRAAGNPLLADTRLNIFKYSGDNKERVFNRNSSDDGIALMDLDSLQGDEYYEAEVTIEQDRYKLSFTQPGDVQLLFGNAEEDVVISLLNGTGAEPVPMADTRISVHKVGDERLIWYTNRNTDSTGQAKIALQGLSEGEEFVLKAQHPISDRWFESTVITKENVSNNSGFEFVVGIPPMVVTLINPVTESPIANARVEVKRQREDGSWRREARQTSDENGQVTFHLTEVSEAKFAKLEAWTEERFYGQKTVTTTGSHNFPLGNTQITVRNGRVEGAPLLSQTRLRVYKHSADGRQREFDRDTSVNGIALMELDALQTEEFYRAEVTVENDKFIQDFTSMGAVDLTFGDLAEDTLVTLLNGTQAQPTPLTDWRIAVHQVTPERLIWVANKNTDGSGQAKLPLEGLNDGQQYVLKAQHPISNKWFESEVISNNNNFTFVVGAPALVINLTHPANGTAMANARIEVRRQGDEPDSWKWEARANTDANGQATFHLKDITPTSPVQLRMRTEEGFWASTELTSTGTHNLPFGNVPVTVINKDDNMPIVNKRVDAFWMDADNQLNHEARYNTTANGEVLFELDRLEEGTRYALKVHNPFGENKRYYGPIVYREGAIEFLVAKGEQTELDLEDPEVFITSPTRDQVNGTGFLLGGVASDNNSISRIEVSVSDPAKGVSEGEAVLLNNGQWQFSIDEAAITLNENITVTATAFDLALNSAQYSKTFEVVEDMEPPSISIVSHQDNDDVNETGFTVIGQASDDTGVVTVTATLTDPVLGTTIDAQSVSVAEDGQWALIVTNGKVSGGQTAALSLTATDSSDKTTDLDINLMVQTIVPQQQQLISRITFGMTPELYINQPDATTFMTQQLAPATIDDSELQAQIDAMEIAELSDLRAMQLHYMLYSKRQLNEVMTWFWDNHFNTNFNVHRNVAFELAENQAFRQNALGNFRDLLAISAQSPAMIYYLNNAQNVVGRPNENYAREIMELSTMGVDGGYTAQDISELARIFTGWHEQDGAFFFNEEQHDFGDKTFLGVTIQGEGLAEGERALDILASHPSTARNICRKLITLFVSDVPVTSLQGQCEGQFLASNGDIASVVQIILSSNEFVSLEHQGNKIKTPLEMILAGIRSVNATPNYEEINDTLARLAYSLFTYPVPTGLGETGAGWISSNALLERIRFANKFALEGEAGASVDLMSLLMAMGYSSADAIVGVLADLTLNGRLTDLERDIATALLNENIAEGESFSMQSPDAEQKLQRLLGTMLSYPAFQYQ